MKRLSSTIIFISVSLTLVLSIGGATQKKKSFPSPDTATTQTQANFAGTWSGTYRSNQVEPVDVTLIFQQRGATVTGTYLSKNGAQGVISGSVTAGSQTLVAKATQTTPTCRGQFAMSATISDNTLNWTFKGKDCLGAENGSGSATK